MEKGETPSPLSLRPRRCVLEGWMGVGHLDTGKVVMVLPEGIQGTSSKPTAFLRLPNTLRKTLSPVGTLAHKHIPNL